MTRSFPFPDLAEFIEDRAYEVCEANGRTCEKAVRQLKRLAAYYAKPRRGLRSRRQMLADIYLMIGELYLYHGLASRSIRWFKKACQATGTYSAPFHSLALAQANLGDIDGATHSLEEELLLAPGNLYTYLMLADLYQQSGDYDRFEETLHRLLLRDAENLEALHRLITHYEQSQPDAEVELLRRRLIAIRRDFSRTELTIWVYHMCREGRFAEAIRVLADLQARGPAAPTYHLLKAAVYGEVRQFTRKKRELATFRRKIDGDGTSVGSELKEFEQVFGPEAVAKLSKRLALCAPCSPGDTKPEAITQDSNS